MSGKKYLIDAIKKDHGRPVLTLDAGNVLFKNPAKAKRQNDVTIAKGLLSGYQLIGYDAVGVSPLDLIGGKLFFDSINDSNIPWVTANVSSKDKRVTFTPYLLKEIGDVTVGVIGLTGSPEQKIADFNVTDWRASLNEVLQKVEPECDLIILLSSLSNKNIQELVQEYPQINIIFTADKRRGNLPPKILNKTLITQAAGRGKYLGQLDVHLDESLDWRNQGSYTSKAHKVYPKNGPKEMEELVQQIRKQLRKSS